MCREDYYKFTYCIMPCAFFKHGTILVDRVKKNKKDMIEAMKRTWSIIELEKEQTRNMTPNFTVDVKPINTNHTGIIITIPEAVESQEAVYIGIIYDKTKNFRYFTYEVSKGNEGETLYFLCECTSYGNHINHSFHYERDKSVFIKGLSELFVTKLS